MGYLYWLRVKSSNPLHTELNFGYLKGTKFCLESKVSFTDISSIASFEPFLIAWLREYCTFSTIMFYYQTFCPLQICSLLDCS